jgi:hypothetical protein
MKKLAIFAALIIGGCSTHVPTIRPCGVLADSLMNVTATTRDGERRISRHFEAGVRAGCWGRQ